MPQKKEKRTYTFRKDRDVAIESGSLGHGIEKSQKETAKKLRKLVDW